MTKIPDKLVRVTLYSNDPVYYKVSTRSIEIIVTHRDFIFLSLLERQLNGTPGAEGPVFAVEVLNDNVVIPLNPSAFDPSDISEAKEGENPSSKA